MFGKKKETTKPYTIIKSYYGIADHIGMGDDKIALCGYDNGIQTDYKYSKIDIIDRIPNQHSGFFYCPQCAEKATGFDAETIESYRK